MDAVIFGNGLNIKFGGTNYLNGKIIRRGFGLIQQDKKSHDVVPPEILDLFKKMYEEVPDITVGLYDGLDSEIDDDLIDFKNNYKSRKLVDMGSVGMEDYFLVLHLIYTYNRINQKDKSIKKFFDKSNEETANECFKDLCLMGIYNNGKINQLYKRYSPRFKNFINQFDTVFTTNYDSNLDTVYQGHDEVQHIHGKFDELDQLYDKESLRNSLSDQQFKRNHLINPKKYSYLHSTALMSYSGQSKYKSMKDRLNLDSLKIEDILKTPDSMVDATAKKLAIEAKEIQAKNPDKHFQRPEAFKKYIDFKGNLSVIGLSPSNDNYIFSNRDVHFIYYFFSNEDRNLAKQILPKSSEFKSVNELWDKLQ